MTPVASQPTDQCTVSSAGELKPSWKIRCQLPAGFPAGMGSGGWDDRAGVAAALLCPAPGSVLPDWHPARVRVTSAAVATAGHAPTRPRALRTVSPPRPGCQTAACRTSVPVTRAVTQKIGQRGHGQAGGR